MSHPQKPGQGKGYKLGSRILALNPRFNYLPKTDRYLFSTEQPKHRFNVIGTGVNGQEHLRVTLMEGRANIHGVYDPSPMSVEAAKNDFQRFSPNGNLVVYDFVKDACHDPDVDGLIISTPNHTHLDILREAIRSGKHILLEKPMATTIADAHEILELTKNYSAVFRIGLQYRYKAIYAEAIHEALVRNAIGEIKTISIIEHRVPFLDKVRQWNKFSKYSGGTLVEKCCHYFDLFNLFAGSRPAQVYATGSQAVNFTEFEYDQERSDILDNAFVNVIYENDIRAHLNLCMFSPMFYEEIVLCGDGGRLKAFENEDFLPVQRPSTHLEILRGEHKPSTITTPCYPTYIQSSGHHGATYFEHMDFVNQIEGLENNAPTADEGFWSIVIGAAAEESVRTGQVVLIPDLLKQHGVKR